MFLFFSSIYFLALPKHLHVVLIGKYLRPIYQTLLLFMTIHYYLITHTILINRHNNIYENPKHSGKNIIFFLPYTQQNITLGTNTDITLSPYLSRIFVYHKKSILFILLIFFYYFQLLTFYTSALAWGGIID